MPDESAEEVINKLVEDEHQSGASVRQETASEKNLRRLVEMEEQKEKDKEQTAKVAATVFVVFPLLVVIGIATYILIRAIFP